MSKLCRRLAEPRPRRERSAAALCKLTVVTIERESDCSTLPKPVVRAYVEIMQTQHQFRPRREKMMYVGCKLISTLDPAGSGQLQRSAN